MSARNETVTVYSYWVTDDKGHSVPSTSKTTLSRIRHELGSEPLLGTGVEVPVSDLDESGMFERRPTGWPQFLASAY